MRTRRIAEARGLLEVRIDPDRIFPYVRPFEGNELSMPLGHDVYVHVLHDLDGVTEHVSAEQLQELGIQPGEAYPRALENLARFVRGASGLHAVREGPGGRHGLWRGSGLASSCLVLPGLHRWATANLGVTEVLASVPHRDALVLFPLGDRAFREAMRGYIRETEAGAKPITGELFLIPADGVPRPVAEDAPIAEGA